ncbi:MAG TPA: very short patch repair endonuclease [Planctomycetota bacterium]|nr:very short patch repair endonuclease [Planctomycetota bacterium]
MQSVRQKSTTAESALRSELHALGIRYRVQVPVLTAPRRVADIAMRSLRVAIFVDGCFWHGCPIHATWPRENAAFWREKIVANRARDADTNARLHLGGWTVIRVWAHEPPDQAAKRIASIVERLRSRKER